MDTSPNVGLSRVRPTGQEITNRLHGCRGVNHMEVKFRVQSMATCLAWGRTAHGFQVLCTPIFKATLVHTDLHSLVTHPTMPLEKNRHYAAALFFPTA